MPNQTPNETSTVCAATAAARPVPSDTGGPRLYMVATPIGNLEDLSPHAARVLQEADVIACEDTRRTAKLLAFLMVSKPCRSVREHNEVSAGMRLLDEARERHWSVAYVSDAGTPGVSDPGARLAELAHQRGIPVYAVTGPSAWAAAVSVAGFAATASYFVGFLPRRGQDCADVVRRALAIAPCQLVFFESPHRIGSSLERLARWLPASTRVCLCREMTKMFESNRVCTLADAVKTLEQEPTRGEFAVVVEIAATPPGPLLRLGGATALADAGAPRTAADSMLGLTDAAAETTSPNLAILGRRALAESHATGSLRTAARNLAKAHPHFTSRDIYQAALNLRGDENGLRQEGYAGGAP